MNIKKWKGEEAEKSVIKFHYAELHTNARMSYKDVYPYLDTTMKGPITVAGHTMSGNGSRILILTIADGDRFLQLWDIKELALNESEGSGCSQQSIPSEKSLPKKSFQSEILACMKVPLADKSSYECYLNWDGTQFVYNNLVQENPMSFYKVHPNSNASDENVTKYVFNQGGVDDNKCPGLRKFFGKATFHIIATQDQKAEDELFVTCNDVAIKIYRVFGEWNHVRTIKFDHLWSGAKLDIDSIGSQLKQLGGPYLVIGNPDARKVSTWNIKKGTLISSFRDITNEQFKALRSSTAISKDGRMIAIPGKHHVDIFWTTTWTRAASYTIRDTVHAPLIGTLKFIRNDTQLMVDYTSCVPTCQENHGGIFNTNNLTLVEELITAGSSAMEVFADDKAHPLVIDVGFSQLSLYYLENRTFNSPSRRKIQCKRKGNCFIDDSYNYGYVETLAFSGLTFRAEKFIIPVNTRRHHRPDFPFVIVTVLDNNAQVCQKLQIPLPKNWDFNLEQLNFIGHRLGSHMALYLKGFGLIWSLPTTTQEKFTLRLIHSCANNTDEKDKTHWEICTHDQLYGISPDGTVNLTKSLDDPVRGTEIAFLEGAAFLSEIFQHADDILRDDILQYIGKYINLHIPGTECDSNIVRYVSEKWNIDTHHSTVLLWKVLLAYPIGRWVPRQDMVLDTNPIWILLNKNDDSFKAYELALVFIEYCIQQAKLEMDPHFLLPIRQCFQKLANPKNHYSDVTFELFRQLAYIPARDRDFIMKHYWIAEPHKFLWRFWKPYTKGLHQSHDQVLQVTQEPVEHPSEHVFSRDIYLATYDMLWFDQRENTSNSKDHMERALINNAIDDGDKTWELDWLQNRMRYVESAENLTYDLPGYRESHRFFFPETIYYTATPLQVREYEKRTKKIISETINTSEMSIIAQAKSHMLHSDSGDEGGYSWQDSEENSSDGTTNSENIAALLKLIKQLHNEQHQAFEKLKQDQQDVKMQQKNVMEMLGRLSGSNSPTCQ
ncbi:hypothetical protein FBU30_008568 [Linnemannia zychae]|nr:hypothetical protein FBU30_008568 [Linnemannia zychae]